MFRSFIEGKNFQNTPLGAGIWLVGLRKRYKSKGDSKNTAKNYRILDAQNWNI